ncbi:acyl-CoA/acyl-ACP dehydrogenase, partial [Achromobacter ruhlandii]
RAGWRGVKGGVGCRDGRDGVAAVAPRVVAEGVGGGDGGVDKGTARARGRMVYGRPSGQSEGGRCPRARAESKVEAASLMRYEACRLFDAHEPCGAQANMAKLLAADASWEAANACLQFHGGFGFATEYDVERKFRETRLYQVAPISTNLILSYVAEHILGLPRSF